MKNDTPLPRVIFNHDGCTHWPPHGFCGRKGGGDLPLSPKAFQRGIMRFFDGTQVDTIFWCLGTDLFTANLKTGERIGEQFPPNLDEAHGLPAHLRPGVAQARALWAAGTDDLTLATEGAHRGRRQIYASFRMNDAHFVHWKAFFDEECDLHWARFNREHPEWTVDGGKSVLDFAHPEVRAYRLRQIREVCSRYDIDGIELDFFRHPRYFKDPAAEKAPIFTRYLREIRRTVDRCARKRGRPIRIAARTPHNLRECLSIGIDLQAWLEDRSLDLLVLGDGNLTNELPIEDAVAFAHANRVAVYPCLNWYKPDPMTWGWAANARAKGVDGLYFFNWQYDRRCYDGKGAILRTLAGADRHRSKLYRADHLFPGLGWHLAAPESCPLPMTYAGDILQAPRSGPCTIEGHQAGMRMHFAGETMRVSIRIADTRADLRKARITLFVTASPPGQARGLTVRLNNMLLKPSRDYHSPLRDGLRVFEKPHTTTNVVYGDAMVYAPTHLFQVDANTLVEGVNDIELIPNSIKGRFVIKAVNMLVDYNASGRK
jgi:hypothetical protein